MSGVVMSMQDEVDKLDKEISDRHADELAALEKRLASSGEAGGEATSQLAYSLYETKLTNGTSKVTLQGSQTPLITPYCNPIL
jgi:hypothetical protein